LVNESQQRIGDTDEDRMFENDLHLYVILKPSISNGFSTFNGESIEYILNRNTRQKICNFVKKMLLIDNEILGKMKHYNREGNVSLWNEVMNLPHSLKIDDVNKTYSLRRDIIATLCKWDFVTTAEVPFEISIQQKNKKESDGITAKYPTNINNIFADEWFMVDKKYWRDWRFTYTTMDNESKENYFDFNESDTLQDIINLDKSIDNLKSNVGNSYSFWTGNQQRLNMTDNIICKIAACNVNIKTKKTGIRITNSIYTHIWVLYKLMFTEDIDFMQKKIWGLSFHLFNRICRIDENARLKYST
jgi:hypothetical protein